MKLFTSVTGFVSAFTTPTAAGPPGLPCARAEGAISRVGTANAAITRFMVSEPSFHGCHGGTIPRAQGFCGAALEWRSGRCACFWPCRRYVKSHRHRRSGIASLVREICVAADDALDFKTLFRSTPTPLMVVSPDLTIVEVNDSYTEAVGRNREKLVGRHLFDAFPAADENGLRLRSSLQRVFASGTADFLPVLHYPIPTEEENGSADRYWSCSHVPIKGADRQIRYVMQNAQDITDIHEGRATRGSSHPTGPEELGSSVLSRAERIQALNLSLLAESAQFRNLFMRAPSFMCLLRGPDYRIELANTAFMDLVGQRQLTGRTFREAIPEADGQLYLDLLEKVYESGEAFVGKQMRAEFERKPGEGPEEVFISFVFQPILRRGRQGDRHLRRRQRRDRSRACGTVSGAAGARTASPGPQHACDRSGRHELDGAHRGNDRRLSMGVFRPNLVPGTHALAPDGGDPAVRLVPSSSASGDRSLRGRRFRTDHPGRPRRGAAVAARRATRG